jgi:excinuclease UvrABC nuclease subunit
MALHLNILEAAPATTPQSKKFLTGGKTISELESEMHFFAQNLEFEKAAELRDEIRLMKEKLKK